MFLKRSLIFPILLFSSISLHWSLRKAFLSLLAILWNFAFRCLYLSISPLLFGSLSRIGNLVLRSPKDLCTLLCLQSQSCTTLCAPKDYSPPGTSLCPWGFSRQDYWSGLSYPPPGDRLNPGIYPGLLH